MTAWRPQEGPQTEFLSRPEDEALYGGSKGGGKTDALLMEALRQINHAEYRALILRRTYPKLSEIIDRSHKWYPRCGGKYSASDHTWTFSSGAKIRFGHVQHERDKDNYQGHEYQFIGFDQLEEFSESIYLFIIAQNRTSYPGLRCYVRATANPGGEGHTWVKKRFIDSKIPNQSYKIEYNIDGRLVTRSQIFVPATIYDNKILLENNPNYLASLMQLPERERKALLDGNWDVFEGQYFSEFTRSKHVVKPFQIPAEWRKFVMGDYGFTAPSAVYWGATDCDGNVYIYRELYETGLTYSALADKIVDLSKNETIEYRVFDPAIWAKSASTGESGAETMSKRGCSLRKADNNRIIGWGRVREFLVGPSGEPKLFIFDTCTNLIESLIALKHDDYNVEDVSSKCEDHGPDALRYGLMSRPRPTKKAEEFVLKTYTERVHDWQRKRRAAIARRQKGRGVDTILGGNW